MEFEYYKTKDGKELVDDELDSIPDLKTQKSLANKILYYEQKTFFEFQRGRELEKIDGTNLWELKFRISPPYRAICLLLSLTKFLILHIFKKDYDNKIDRSTIKIGLSRESEYKLNH